MWDILPVALAVVAIFLSATEHPRASAIAGYCSLAVSQLGRLMVRRRARVHAGSAEAE